MKYVTRSNRWSDELEMDLLMPETITIFEGDTQDTGLLDQNGERLYRMPEPIGFVLKNDN